MQQIASQRIFFVYADFVENGGKNLRFRQKTDTRGWGLRSTLSEGTFHFCLLTQFYVTGGIYCCLNRILGATRKYRAFAPLMFRLHKFLVIKFCNAEITKFQNLGCVRLGNLDLGFKFRICNRTRNLKTDFKAKISVLGFPFFPFFREIRKRI